jgi:UDP-3-O-[3-hydroxymyristoyl] glucosamine N-acyltransferase
MTLTLGEIARFLGARQGATDGPADLTTNGSTIGPTMGDLSGDPALPIHGIAPLETATAGDLSFLTNSRYTNSAKTSQAGAILTSRALGAALAGRPLLFSTNPYRDFARVVTRWFDPRRPPSPGRHPTAVVAEDAEIGPDCHLGAYVVVGAGARIGARTVLHPFTYIGAGASLGEDCLCHPRATVLDGVRMGHRVIVQPGAVLGADGFGFAPDVPHGYVKMPQLGGLILGDDVEVQANACIDRGALGNTVLGPGTKVDNLVQIGHNVQIGAHTVLASQTGISGSTRIGNWCTFAGQAGVAGHLHIGDGAIVTAQGGVGKDVPPKAMVSGTPAKPFMESRRDLAELGRIGLLRRRVAELEGRIAALEEAAPPPSGTAATDKPPI